MITIAGLLVIAAILVIGVSWIAPRLRVAAPILLVPIGVVVGLVPGVPVIEIEPELILAIVLPPILYAAAVNVPITDFRRNLRSITGLSVGLVVLSAIAIGFLVHALLPAVPLAAAIALGAVVSPPDAVAATSIGKRLGLPSRLVTVLEGEGLVNDATALVLLRSAIAAIGGTVTLLDVAADFVFAVVVAIAVGAIVGLVSVWARSRISQPTLTTAISFVVPFAAFLPAEALHASGVLAVVVAGIITGVKSTRHFSAQDRISERMNWRTIQLLLENGVFLVMGYQLPQIIAEVEHEHLSVWGAVGIGLLLVLGLLVVRGAFIVPMVLSLRREQRKAQRHIDRVDAFLASPRAESMRPPAGSTSRRSWERIMRRRRNDWQALASDGLGWRGGAVLTWAGMRGVVTLAAAQSLPADVPLRAQLVLIAFTVAAVSLVGYGTSLPLVIRLLRIDGADERAATTELFSLVDEIVAAGATRLRNPALTRADGEPFDPEVVEEILRNRARLANNYRELATDPIGGRAAQSAALYRLMLEAEQAALVDARASGAYSAETLERTQSVIDTDLARAAQDGTLG